MFTIYQINFRPPKYNSYEIKGKKDWEIALYPRDILSRRVPIDRPAIDSAGHLSSIVSHDNPCQGLDVPVVCQV